MPTGATRSGSRTTSSTTGCPPGHRTVATSSSRATSESTTTRSTSWTSTGSTSSASRTARRTTSRRSGSPSKLTNTHLDAVPDEPGHRPVSDHALRDGAQVRQPELVLGRPLTEHAGDGAEREREADDPLGVAFLEPVHLELQRPAQAA